MGFFQIRREYPTTNAVRQRFFFKKVSGIDYRFISSFSWDVMLAHVPTANWGWNPHVKKPVARNEVKHTLSDNQLNEDMYLILNLILGLSQSLYFVGSKRRMQGNETRFRLLVWPIWQADNKRRLTFHAHLCCHATIGHKWIYTRTIRSEWSKQRARVLSPIQMTF